MINFNIAKFEKSVTGLNQMPTDNLPEIVFSGRSNVGKSSLINKIVNRNLLARVSTKPGKTANINLYNLGNVRFVDLPGYGYAKVSFAEKKRWAELVDGYLRNSSNIACVIQIIDSRHTPSSQDMQMIDFLWQKNIPFIIVESKVDKLKKRERELRESESFKELEQYKSIEKIFFSSVTGEGIDKIKSSILSKLDFFKKGK